MQVTTELLDDCKKNKRLAQSQLYKEVFSYLMNICIRYKSDYDSAGASLNAIYLKILTNLDKFNHTDSFMAWIKRIAVNHLIDEYRKDKRLKSKVAFVEENQIANESAHFHEEDAKMESEYLLRMIQELPEVTGRVFNLYAIDGYKHREIAELLEMSENTSKWHVREARMKLKTMLVEYNEIV